MRPKGVMENAANLLLKLAIKIDQKVAAGDEVEARERRVLEQTVVGEKDQVADLPPDAVMLALMDEEAPQAVLADVRGNRRGIAAVPGHGQRTRVEVAGKHLNFGTRLTTRHLLEQQNRNRVGLLPGGATGYPNAHRIIIT